MKLVLTLGYRLATKLVNQAVIRGDQSVNRVVVGGSQAEVPAQVAPVVRAILQGGRGESEDIVDAHDRNLIPDVHLFLFLSVAQPLHP